jgi:hypothetical protein
MSTLSTAFKPGTSQPATIGLFLPGSALAASWVGVNLAFPGLAPSGIPSVVTRLGIHALILTGLWLGLSRTDFSTSKRVIIWLSVAVPFTVWLALVWNLALNGAFQPIPGVVGLPRLPIAIFAPVIIGLFLLLRSESIAALLDATPAYRVPACNRSRERTKRRDGLEYLRVARFRDRHCHGHAQQPRAFADIRTGYSGLAGRYLSNRADSRLRGPDLDPAARPFNPAAQAIGRPAGERKPGILKA